MSKSLLELIPAGEPPANDALLGGFLEYVQGRQLELYPTQEAAILELFEGRNVILNTPTGSGKSLVASALHFQSLAQRRRSFYTCPIKALVNEKWLALCRDFGPENVGLATGDATVNRAAPILCCTAEILANLALREGPRAAVHDVVMDEFHYYADRERGVAWQVPLLTLPQTRFLLMSATLGDTSFFENALTRLNGRPTVTVASRERPVPLEFAYSELALARTLESLLADGKGPVYVVHFTQLDAANSAQDFMSINACTREEKAEIARATEGFKFTSPHGPEVKKWLRAGIGIHHAGLLPKYRLLVEQLAQRGLLKVICGTDTLGVGINVPIRTVLFTRLSKFDGEKLGLLSARDFHQISGRAGRKGFDDRGWVVAQAPEHRIENLKLEEKARRDGKRASKRAAPDKHFVNWDKNTFLRLLAAPPERLTSRFQVSHAMLLNVLSRPGDGCRAMQRLIQDCHDSPKARKEHTRRGWQLFRSLLDRRIIEIPPGPARSRGLEPVSERERAPDGSKLRVNVELQEDFSMDQALSLYLLDTLPLLDPASADYALDLLTLVESILEDPDIILRRQLDKLKAARLAELKQDGVEYEERLLELEKLEHPKPNREFIYSTFNAFADRHPWISQENIRPKSIAREMFEQFRSFADYIRDYELHRAEGVLLRHLSSVHKVLRQTVPDHAKTDAVQELEVYLGAMLRQVDSSLIDEWERMRDPSTGSGQAPAWQPAAPTPELKPPGAEEAARDCTRDSRAFTAAVRNRIFTFLRPLALGDLESSLEVLAAWEIERSAPSAAAPLPAPAPPVPLDDEGQAWNASRLREALEPHRVEHSRILLDPEARNQRHTHVKVSEDRQTWRVQQVLVDPEAHNDWMAEFQVNLADSRRLGEPAMKLLRLAPLGVS